MVNCICSAIRSKNLIKFTYDGHERIVEPHLLGEKTSGNIALSAYQVGGYSESDRSPYWRNYIISDMSDVQILPELFSGARPGYNPNDRTMSRIICRI